MTNLNNVISIDETSIDETSIDTYIDNQYGWSLKGETIKVRKNVNRIRYTVICAINNKRVINVKIIKNSCNGETFLKFIEETINKLFKKSYFFYWIMQEYIIIKN
jgi:hypothetical protein